MDRTKLETAESFALPHRCAARIAVFGTGSAALQAWERLSLETGIEIVAFLDNNERRRATPFVGLPVLAPAELEPASIDAVLVGSMYATEITRQLVELGVPESRVYTSVESLLTAPVTARASSLAVPRDSGPRPKILNFQVNDICNARCIMCNVWKQKRDRELTVEEFTTLLSDPHFSEVEHIGITGGEPTLRRDLPEFYLAALECCPALAAASFITHGLDTERVLAAYPRVAEAYRARGKSFSGMVSIDGVGTLHDRIRGREGAFERATRTLFGLNQAGVPTIAACTVVRSNVWGVWDMLEWGQANGVYVRFRVGEFINRLYNNTATDEIRAFDPAETSAVISFFQHLIHSYEPEEAVRRTYATIISLVSGGERLVGCPYQTGAAVSVDCRGRFAVCAPKGQYHPLGDDAGTAVHAVEAERQQIIKDHCASCIHDCHDEWLPLVAEQKTVGVAVEGRLAAPRTLPLFRTAGQAASPMRKVLVLGWYGTETIGDLAILAGIDSEYRRNHPGVRFVVPSEFPDYTRHNLSRIGLDCLVTSYGDPELVGDLWGCDTVIIGGGPLMDIPRIAMLATIFERARALGRRTVIEGCGVGPVNQAATKDAILRLAAVADEIRLRDAGSIRTLRELGADASASVVADPGARWVQSTGRRHVGDSDGPIVVFARELTSEYPQATSIDDATAAVSGFLRKVCDWFPNRRVQLHAMHHFPVGGDDRLYARRVARTVDRSNCLVDEVPRTPLETLDIMAASSFVICMRFHSLVFAHGIGAPLLAIDYTDGGKVSHFLAEHGLKDRGVSFAGLDAVDRQRLVAIGTPDKAVA